jgi:ABC-2 type transport system ATP-binding protein
MDEADLYSDRIAIINRGKLVKQGTAEELKRSIGGQVILFNLQKIDVTEESLRKLRNVETVKEVILTNSELSILVEDAETSLPQIMDLLRSEDIQTEKISITKPTLDDVFLKYAGTRLETSGRISEVTQMRRMIRKG